jgi:hypothetical protein
MENQPVEWEFNYSYGHFPWEFLRCPSMSQVGIAGCVGCENKNKIVSNVFVIQDLDFNDYTSWVRQQCGLDG